eukprot:scaffold28_cov312-Pinguiococcus_pyrenoidosus.AAC.16
MERRKPPEQRTSNADSTIFRSPLSSGANLNGTHSTNAELSTAPSPPESLCTASESSSAGAESVVGGGPLRGLASSMASVALDGSGATLGAAMTLPKMASRTCSARLPRRWRASIHGRQKLSPQVTHRTTAVCDSHSPQSTCAASEAIGATQRAHTPRSRSRATEGFGRGKCDDLMRGGIQNCSAAFEFYGARAEP